MWLANNKTRIIAYAVFDKHQQNEHLYYENRNSEKKNRIWAETGSRTHLLTEKKTARDNIYK